MFEEYSSLPLSWKDEGVGEANKAEILVYIIKICNSSKF